jgi:diphosphate-dependent phosphofructokinase
MHPLQKKRLEYVPQIPSQLLKPNEVAFRRKLQERKSASHLRHLFPKTWEQKGAELVAGHGKKTPLRIGIFFSGGQAPGGHNVIAGVWDTIQKISTSSQLIGFINGPSGFIEKKWRYLKACEIDEVRNLGGFDLIGSGRTKIETPDQFSSCMQVCQELTLDGLVVIGGDDSNTNAAILAEYFILNNCPTKVIGVPKTIDGDLRSVEIEMSFGFDSACKTYAELIGNIGRDALSARKYYHFIKLMGRSASHITLECALATQPNLAFIGEEAKSLEAIVKEISDLVQERKAIGKEFGIILFPEGLLEFIPEMRALIQELNQLLARGETQENLKPRNKSLFHMLPEKIQAQLLLERDSHGNVALSQIETEGLFIELVKEELQKRSYPGKFTPVAHFFGYEGRSCYPSNFDANYCYALGCMAAIGIRDEMSGVICAIQNLAQDQENWHCLLVPILQMMHMEERKGTQKPVIQKALVNLEGKPFLEFSEKREAWKLNDAYQNPGPMQFFGESALTDSVPLTMG